MKDLDFRTGDVATSVLHGVGVVESDCNDYVYPIRVRFKNGTAQTFTRDGKYNLVCSKRSLYHGEIHGDPYAGLEGKPVREKNIKSYKQRTLDKWFWLIMNPGKNDTDYMIATRYPDELKILNNCWACELVKRDTVPPAPDCSKCPIKGFRDDRCYIIGSTFWKWRENKTSENARKVYDTIFNTWEE